MSVSATVVGVDVGSSSSRALALDSDGGIRGRAVVAHPRHQTTAIGEMDPSAWRVSAIGAIQRLGMSPNAIGFGGLGPTTVASGGELALTFRFPVGDISDPRDQHRAHAAVLDARVPGGTSPRLLWDWLVDELGSESGFQSVWPGDEPIPGFGSPVAVGTAVAETSSENGIGAGIPLVPATNDGYLSAWAAGIDVPGRGFDPGGSTGGLGVAVAGLGPTTPYGIPSAVPGVVIAGGPTAAHGAMLDWWSATTGTSLTELLSLAEVEPPGSDGVFVLPFLEGERAPRWNSALSAEIVGLRSRHGPGTVARAILECTAYGLAHIADSLAVQGIVMDRLVSCGSTSRSRLWVAIKSSVLGVPVDVPSETEMAAYGAALAAGSAVGWWPRPGNGSAGDWPVPAMTTVEADPDPIHAARYRDFVSLGDAAEARIATTSQRSEVGGG